MTTNSRRALLARAWALALMTLLVAGLLAACAGPAATPVPDDPYAILARSADADYDRLKIGVGLKTSGVPDGDITIEPGAIELVVDGPAGKGSLRLALPVAALGPSGADLAELGVTGDTLELEVLFDGEAVYARSPLFASLLPLMLAQLGQAVDGDLTGWLRLASMDEIEGLAGAMGALPSATPAASAALGDLPPAELKAQLEEAGVVLTFAGTEQRNGLEAQHLTTTVDLDKLAASEMAGQLPADQLSQFQGLAGQGTIKLDLWFAKATGALSEAVVEVAGTGGEGSAQLTMLLGDPGNVAIEAPADFVEVPLMQMLLPVLEMLGGGLVP